ncbi:MAG: hypothetical protein EXX96DRAFT_605739 [Benjaminiella poitrasii]|nr:MAG: hypothetical protein EXX96DRAFT_605739 [Benjaminiella poitrasii]
MKRRVSRKGMEVAVEFGDIGDAQGGNEYLVEDTPQNTADEKLEEMVLELEEMMITKTKRYKKYGSEQITRFINILQETGGIVPKAAKELVAYLLAVLIDF